LAFSAFNFNMTPLLPQRHTGQRSDQGHDQHGADECDTLLTVKGRLGA
jgi:hypothetical protein